MPDCTLICTAASLSALPLIESFSRPCIRVCVGGRVVGVDGGEWEGVAGWVGSQRRVKATVKRPIAVVCV